MRSPNQSRELKTMAEQKKNFGGIKMKNIFTNKHGIRIIIGLIVLSIALTFTGCSNKQKTPDKMSEEELIDYIADYYDSYDDVNHSEANDTGATAGQTIDLGQAVTVTPFGYSGNGSVRIDVDENILNSLISRETMQEYLELIGCSEYGYTLYDLLDFKEDKHTPPLSNGSVCIIYVGISSRLKEIEESIESFKQRLGVNFNSTLTYEINGLEEGTCLDVYPFIEQYISAPISNDCLMLEGGNGIGVVNIEFPEDLSFEIQGFYFSRGFYTNSLKIVRNNHQVGTVSFTFNNLNLENSYPSYEASGLSNGDYLALRSEVTCDNPDFMNGYFIPNRKYFTVSGLGDFVDSYSQISQAEMQNIKTKVMEKLNEEDDYTFEALYYGEAKPTTTIENNSKTILIFVISSLDFFGEKKISAITVDKLSIKDGKISFDINMLDIYTNYEEDSVASEITDAYSDYNVVAVNI